MTGEMIEPVWTEDCGCRVAFDVTKRDLRPFFFDGEQAEARAIAAHINNERHLAKYGGPTHWAYHANGRHLLGVRLKQ
jgi:hypothetical protein